VVNSTFNRFGKNLPPVKTGQRFGEQTQKNKKLGLFSERRFLIFTKRGPIEIAFKPVHYTSAIISAFVGITSIIYWSAQGIYSAIDVAQKNDIITEASANIPDPIENDSDTVVDVESQSNIILPTLIKFFDVNQKENNKVLIIDCHSFPKSPLPYELNQEKSRPEICIGTDNFHTSKKLKNSFRKLFCCSICNFIFII